MLLPPLFIFINRIKVFKRLCGSKYSGLDQVAPSIKKKSDILEVVLWNIMRIFLHWTRCVITSLLLCCAVVGMFFGIRCQFYILCVYYLRKQIKSNGRQQRLIKIVRLYLRIFNALVLAHRALWFK